MTITRPDRSSPILVAVLACSVMVTGVSLLLGSGREASVTIGWPVSASTLLNMSERKLHVLVFAAGGLGLVAMLAVGLTQEVKHRGLRMIVALLSAAAVAAPPWLLAGHTNPALDRLDQRFDFAQPGWPLWPVWSDPNSAQRQSRDWSTLSAQARSWINAHAHELELPAGTAPETRQALATMHLVSQLWGTGNAQARKREGCILSNETNHWQSPTTVTLDTYLRARIACCDDFAHMLHWLLREQGFESSLIAASGHVFVEVRLPYGWGILDAFSAAYVEGSFERVNRGGHARVLLGRHVAGWPGTDLYRPDFASDRWRLLSTLLVGGFASQRRQDLPPPFPAAPRRPATRS